MVNGDGNGDGNGQNPGGGNGDGNDGTDHCGRRRQRSVDTHRVFPVHTDWRRIAPFSGPRN